MHRGRGIDDGRRFFHLQVNKPGLQLGDKRAGGFLFRLGIELTVLILKELKFFCRRPKILFSQLDFFLQKRF